jgi:DNA primase
MINNEIFALAKTYLSKVRPSGPENIMAACPFHSRGDGTEEKTPSFAMSLLNGLFLCHSCGARGNLRTFLKQVSITPSLIEGQYKYLLEAAEAGMGPPPDPVRPKIFSSSPIDDQLLGLWNYCPQDLVAAGFTEQTLQYFEVGFDKWHNRITWPMRDLKGQLCGVSGRAVVEGQKPRFKIYDKEYKVWGLPERINWDKRTVLYNAHRIYPEVYFNPQPQPVIVVEGFKACAWVHQAGFPLVNALIGASLSWEHRWVLERFGAPVYLFLDNNQAGWAGVNKAIKLLKDSLHVRVIPYPERLLENLEAQPTDCTPEEIHEQYAKAVPWHQIYRAQ